MKPKLFALGLTSLTLLLGLGACASSEDSPIQAREENATATCPATVSTPQGNERKAIMRAIHAVLDNHLSPDGKGPGQPNEYHVRHVRSDGKWAFVMGMIAGKGSNIDWSKTIYADHIKDGLFDGARFEALVEKKGSEWQVVETLDEVAASIGSTDVWWDGLWDRVNTHICEMDENAPDCRTPLSKAIFPVEFSGECGSESAQPPPAQNPAFGTPDRKAMMAAIHGVMDPKLGGQETKYMVSWLQTDGRFAFMTGNVVTADGEVPDWTKTSYAEEVRDGLFDGGHIEALVKKMDDGTWKVVDDYADIGSTDVWWDGLWDRTGAPRSIFPSFGED